MSKPRPYAPPNEAGSQLEASTAASPDQAWFSLGFLLFSSVVFPCLVVVSAIARCSLWVAQDPLNPNLLGDTWQSAFRIASIYVVFTFTFLYPALVLFVPHLLLTLMLSAIAQSSRWKIPALVVLSCIVQITLMLTVLS